MGIGIWQVLIVAVLIFVIFGAGRLPRIMEDIAKGIKSFKKGMNEENSSSQTNEASTEQSSDNKDKSE